MTKILERHKLLAVERSIRNSIEQIDRLEATLRRILHDIAKMSVGFQQGDVQQTTAELDEPVGSVDGKTGTVDADLQRLACEFQILSSAALYETESELEEAALHAQEFARLIELTHARMADTDRWLRTAPAGRHGA